MTDEGMAELKKFTAKLKPDEEFYLEPLTSQDAQKRKVKNEYKRFYWGVLVPAMQYYCPWLDFCSTEDHRYNAHYVIKLTYCLTVRTDLLDYVTVRDPQTHKLEVRAVPFSLKEMSQNEGNKFKYWCQQQVEIHSTLDFERAIDNI